jgi:hypothetical protein
VSTRPIRIGCGAGYSGDRIEPAIELVERGELDVIVFECLAERTMAVAPQARAAANPRATAARVGDIARRRRIVAFLTNREYDFLPFEVM